MWQFHLESDITGDATMRRHRRVRFGRGSVRRHRQDVRQHDRELQVRVPARVQAIREEELGFRKKIRLGDSIPDCGGNSSIRIGLACAYHVLVDIFAESLLVANPNLCEDVDECGDNGICGIDSECQVRVHVGMDL